MVVPGIASRRPPRILTLYQTPESSLPKTNFTKDKRHRFLSRAARPPGMHHYHALGLSIYSSLRRIRELLIQRQINGYSELLEKSTATTVFRATHRKHEREIGSQIRGPAIRKDIFSRSARSESPDHRRRSPILEAKFSVEYDQPQSVDPDVRNALGCSSSNPLHAKEPGRALILASGTPITNTLVKCTLSNVHADGSLEERIHESTPGRDLRRDPHSSNCNLRTLQTSRVSPNSSMSPTSECTVR